MIESLPTSTVGLRLRRSATASGYLGDEAPPAGVVLPEYLLSSDAYRSLPAPARALLVELRRLYDGRNNSRIDMTVKAAADAIGSTSLAAGRKALSDLVDRGFIRRVVVRDVIRLLEVETDRWVLTDLPVDRAPPTNSFLRWKPKEAA